MELLDSPASSRRRFCGTALQVAAATFLGAPFASFGAESTTLRRIGVLWGPRREVWDSYWRQLSAHLARLGYVEGRNIAIHFRSCNPGDHEGCAARAAELVALRVDAIFTGGTKLTEVAQRATRTIPIVTDVGDPVGSGFARSLGKPGGNITGITVGLPEIHRKQIELLRAIAPRTRVLVVMLPERWQTIGLPMGPLEAAARETNMPLHKRVMRVGDAPEFEIAMKEIGRQRGAALLDTLREGFAEIAVRHRVPTVVRTPGEVKAGGLMCYAIGSVNDESQRIATQLGKVLRGMNPAEIPFEKGEGSWLFVNRRTAAALGLTLDPGILVLAHEVFD